MITQQLLDYIKQQLQQGTSREQIKSLLIAKGWQAHDVDEAFAFIENPVSQSQSVSASGQTISSLPGAIAILGQAWTIYKQRIGTFLGILIIPTLVYGLIFGIFFVVSVVFLGVKLLFFRNIDSLFATGVIGVILLCLLVIFLFLMVIIGITWMHTALLYAIKDSQEKIGVIESYKRGWRKIISYWWVSLLMSFIILGGFPFLIVPGIIFAIWFSLALFILIAEDLKGMNALLKSREYVRGRWWSIAWRFLFIAALYLVITFFSFPFLWFFGPIIFIIELFLLYPLAIIYGFLVYSNLRAVKGEIVFTPTRGKKAIFIIAILGIFILTSVIIFSIRSARERTHKAKRQRAIQRAIEQNRTELKWYYPPRKRMRDAKRQSDIRQIRIGLELYYYEHNRYPYSLDELSPKYLRFIPTDPLTNQSYQYQLQPDERGCKVCAYLESAKAQECVTCGELEKLY